MCFYVSCILIYRSTLINTGLWDQIRVDHGREFYLFLFVQDKLRRLFGSTDIQPYAQTSSHNVCITESYYVTVTVQYTLS